MIMGERVYLALSPFPVIGTTRIITFLVGNPYKPSFPLLLGRDHPRYIYFVALPCSTSHQSASPRDSEISNCASGPAAWSPMQIGFPIYGCWTKNRVFFLQNGWFISWKTLLKWMIWGVLYPYFWFNTHMVDQPIIWFWWPWWRKFQPICGGRSWLCFSLSQELVILRPFWNLRHHAPKSPHGQLLLF